MSQKPKKVETAPAPAEQATAEFRLLPFFTSDNKKLNVLQLIIPGGEGKQDQIVDQEFFSGSNLWFTRRAKRALNKIMKRQNLVVKFFQSIQKK
jgi:hypothetical protein